MNGNAMDENRIRKRLGWQWRPIAWVILGACGAALLCALLFAHWHASSPRHFGPVPTESQTVWGLADSSLISLPNVHTTKQSPPQSKELTAIDSPSTADPWTIPPRRSQQGNTVLEVIEHTPEAPTTHPPRPAHDWNGQHQVPLFSGELFHLQVEPKGSPLHNDSHTNDLGQKIPASIPVRNGNESAIEVNDAMHSDVQCNERATRG